MPRSGILTLRDINDAKAMVYGPGGDSLSGLIFSAIHDIPGINEMGIKFEFDTDELQGDATILDYFAKAKKLQATVKNAQIPLALLAALTGGVATQGGTSPNETYELAISGDDLPNWICLQGQCTYQGGLQIGGSGDAHFKTWKCKLSNFEVAMKTDEYAICNFEMVGISTIWVDPAIGRTRMFSIIENQTKTAINATVDSTPPAVTGAVPVSGSSTHNINNPIVITYGEALDLSSVGSDNVTLVNATTGVAIAGTVSAAGSAVTFTPTSALTTATAYILIIDPSVKDKAGNRMAARYTLRFTTA
jgi:hypothetical protein